MVGVKIRQAHQRHNFAGAGIHRHAPNPFSPGFNQRVLQGFVECRLQTAINR